MELATWEAAASPVPSQGILSHLLEDGWVLAGCSTGQFMHRPTCEWFIFLLRCWNLTHEAAWPRLVMNSLVGFALLGSPALCFTVRHPNSCWLFLQSLGKGQIEIGNHIPKGWMHGSTQNPHPTRLASSTETPQTLVPLLPAIPGFPGAPEPSPAG